MLGTVHRHILSVNSLLDRIPRWGALVQSASIGWAPTTLPGMGDVTYMGSALVEHRV